MNARPLALLLALAIFAQISPARAEETREQEIQRDFRQLQRFDDFSAQIGEIMALMRHLVRQDPTHASKYLEVGLTKISPDPRDIKALHGAASAEIYAARVSAISSMVSGVGGVLSSSLKSNKTAFQAEQKLAEADVAKARASIDAETEFLKNLDQMLIEMARKLQSEIAHTPRPRP